MLKYTCKLHANHYERCYAHYCQLLGYRFREQDPNIAKTPSYPWYHFPRYHRTHHSHQITHIYCLQSCEFSAQVQFTYLSVIYVNLSCECYSSSANPLHSARLVKLCKCRTRPRLKLDLSMGLRLSHLTLHLRVRANTHTHLHLQSHASAPTHTHTKQASCRVLLLNSRIALDWLILVDLIWIPQINSWFL